MIHLVSSRELAEQLGISQVHVWRLVEQGEIAPPDYTVGPSAVRGWTKETADQIVRSWSPKRRVRK